MSFVKAKKNLGQHFLADKNIARKIVENLRLESTRMVLEIGPGMGVLTKFLLQKENIHLKVIEIDRELVCYIQQHFPELKDDIIEGDFLKLDLSGLTTEKISIIGNFPYNISSQIFFRVLDFKDNIPEVVGMLQKEVAERLCSAPGNKKYGILSVFLQAYYNLEYLFTVDGHVFLPPPKVKSAVIRLTRNNVLDLGCDEKLFRRVVKTAFNQRRKMLRNSLKQMAEVIPEEFQQLRPEQLGVQQFVLLTRHIESQLKN